MRMSNQKINLQKKGSTDVTAKASSDLHSSFQTVQNAGSSKSSLRVLLRLSRLVRPMAGWMILAVLLGTAGFLCAAGIPVAASWGLSHLLKDPAFSLSGIFWILGLSALFRGILRYGEQACNHYIAFKLLAHIRDLVFGKLRELGPAKLDGRAKGDLISLITADVELLEVFFAHTISPVLIACLCLVLFTAAGMMMHWSVVLLLLVSYLSVGVLLPMIISKKAQTYGKAYRKEQGALNALMLESLKGMKEIRQYAWQKNRADQIAAQTSLLAGKEKQLKSLTTQTGMISAALIAFFCFLMLVLSSYLIQTHQMQPNMLVVALTLQASTFGPFAALANLGTGLSQTIGSAARVLGLLDEEPSIREIESGTRPAFDDLQMEQVSFGYEDKPVLRDFSLQIPKGKILGISGPSGCGKSTTLKLLMRFYDPKTGTIQADGTDLKTIQTNWMRKNESYMSQDTILFNKPISYNLRIAKPDATDEELMEACRKASVHEVILGLEDGYETIAGEGGSRLSTGEKQRIGLARTFLHDANLVLLDEPTSNLDPLNEGAILKAVDESRKDKTILLVSHRKGTLGIADEILQWNPQGQNQKETSDHSAQPSSNS